MDKNHNEKSEGVRRWEEFVRRNEDFFLALANSIDKKKRAAIAKKKKR